jgi:UDP-2-acetamido-2-deoxy-ribo-hexuluronate aminotransferase
MTKTNFVVPFYDLRESIPRRVSLSREVYKALKTGQLLLGEPVRELENRIAQFIGRKYACGVSDGTSALFLALKVLNIGPGDEVITTPLSWIATSNAIKATGAKAVFCDVDNDGNLNFRNLQSLINVKTKCILPVHFYGKMCAIENIVDIAAQYQLPIVEDAAQAFGAQRDGRKAGSFGTLSIFSFNPVKPLASLGEAGMVLTDNDQYQKRLESMRYLGMPNKEDCTEISLNYKIDTLQAQMLLNRFRYLRKNLEKRLEIALLYHSGITSEVNKPSLHNAKDNTFFDFCILTERRDELYRYLLSKGVEVKIRYPKLISEQVPYSNGNYPVAKSFAMNSLCLPIYPNLTYSQIHYTIESINNFYKNHV